MLRGILEDFIKKVVFLLHFEEETCQFKGGYSGQRIQCAKAGNRREDNFFCLGNTKHLYRSRIDGVYVYVCV